MNRNLLDSPSFAQATCSTLEGLASLRPNWDGYGAPVIRKDIIEAARTFVQALPENLACRPRIVPMSPGNLQLEWHRGSKILELEFENAKTIHFLQWHPETGVEEEGVFPVSEIDTGLALIQWFMHGTNGA